MDMNAGIIKKIFVSFAILVIVMVGCSLAWNIHREKKMIYEFASTEAKASHSRDVLYRRWASMHGGVYVPMTEQTPANPLLSDIPERDIVTPSGKKLTLMNPAYMTRQICELGGEYGLFGHLTSLNPLRKENKADAWEANALQQAERGLYEIRGISQIGGQEYLRIMYVLRTEKSCLKCHSKQGYKLGDVRGGVCISVALDEYHSLAQSNIAGLIEVHLILCLLLLAILFVGYKITLNKMEQQNSFEPTPDN
jgi:hypothetical protein